MKTAMIFALGLAMLALTWFLTEPRECKESALPWLKCEGRK